VTRPATRRGRRPAPEPAGEEVPGPLRARYRRRRLAAVLVGLVVVLVGLALTARVLLFDAGLVDVEQVRFEVTTADGTPAAAAGATVTEPQLRDAAAVAIGGPLVAVDTGAVAERVARLPAVAAAEVSLQWPHVVSVRVVQRAPVASVRTPDGPALVDATGTVFPGTAAVDVAGLPVLTVAAPGPTDRSTLAGVAVLGALPEAVRSQVLTVAADVDPSGMPGTITLGLTDGREVRWGSPERVADKAAVLVPLLTQPGRVYDVTSPDLPTIQR
jgi:cell division protein FtsQ